MKTAIYIEDGYEPLGGVSVAVSTETWENQRKGCTETDTDYTYTQAVVKYHEE